MLSFVGWTLNPCINVTPADILGPAVTFFARRVCFCSVAESEVSLCSAHLQTERADFHLQDRYRYLQLCRDVGGPV